MEILEAYRKERPDVFARLPLPKDIAEKMGVPAKEDIVPLNAFLKDFLHIQYAEPVHETETRVAVELVEKAEPLIPKESFEITVLKKEESTDQSVSEHQPETLPDWVNSKESSGTRTLVLGDQISSNLHSSPNDGPNMTFSV